MHVKESVKDFVHDVKRRFSHKRKRESCVTCNSESFDDSSSDSAVETDTHLYTKRDSVSSSSISSPPSTPERSRFAPFVRLRKPSNTSIKYYHNVLHKVRRPDRKRSGNSSQLSGTQTAGRGSPLSFRDAGDERRRIDSSQMEYTEVLDICARTGKTGSMEESTHNSTQTYGTLVGPDDKKSVSESDSRFSAVNSRSDASPFVPSIDPMAQSDSAADLREEEITLAANIDKSTATPSRTTTPAHPMTPTSASSAPVYIPRLTAPSMFLPIPNVRLIFPLSHSLVWWLAPRWSSESAQPKRMSGWCHQFLCILLFRFISFHLEADPSRSQTDPPSALLTKHVPAEQRPRRDVVGEYAGRDVHDMIVSCLRKASFSIRRTSASSFISRIFSRYLHLSHNHSHYSSVSRICMRSFVTLLCLSLLLSVRVPNLQFFSRWRFLSILYPQSVARYY